MDKIKLLVMACEGDIHTEKWISGLSMSDEFDIYLLGMESAGIRKGILENPKVKKVYEIPALKKISKTGNNYHYLGNLIKIRKIVNDLKPDIINTMYLTSYGFIGSLVKNNALLCHFMMGSDIMVTPYKSRIYKWITKYALSRGDFFVMPSRVMHKKVCELYKIPDDKFLMQQYGVGDEIINYPRQGKKYDFVSNRHWLPNSNILVLLEIFSKMKVPQVLAIIGDKGPCEEEIKRKINSLPKARYFGILPYMENIDVVAKSKFYISLTLSDGASLSILEAMALGAIPVLSDIEPSREWVEDGVNGFLIDIDDLSAAIEKMNFIISLPDDKLQIMRRKNEEIMRQRGSLRNNMGRLNDHILLLMESRRKTNR